MCNSFLESTVKSCSVVIPSYNGLDKLKQVLPLLLDATSINNLRIEWIIVDDGGNDGSAAWVKENYSEIKIQPHAENLGFIAAVNTGVGAAQNEIVFLINNDIQAKKDFISPVLPYFNDPSIFAVTLKSLKPKTQEFREGAKGAIFNAGFIKLRHAERHTPAQQRYGTPSLYPVGGHCAIRRSMFLALKGMDPLFSPFYWEDTDLGYRAWKKGWKTIYVPASTVIHEEKGTILESYNESQVRNIRYRNRLLFIWKNIDDKALWRSHLFFLFLRLMFSWLWLDFRFYSVFFKAAALFVKVKRARLERQQRKEVSEDKTLLTLFKSHL